MGARDVKEGYSNLSELKSPEFRYADCGYFIRLVSLVIGGVFTLWPGKVQDIRLSNYFSSVETHRAFIKGCGFILLGIAAASLLAVIVSD